MVDRSGKSSPPVDEEPQNLSLFTDEEWSLVAFDEMNIVEMPIALLTRNTRGIYEIPLSSDGQSRLVCANSSKYGLPNSLAPRVVLGLMWLWGREFSPEDQTFTFKVRDLVRRYMYPSRFKKYSPNGDLLRSVERQIHCLANSQVHTNRWWDKERKGHREVDFGIIDGVMTVDKGGPNRPRVLEVTWGRYFWKSMVNRYTKSIDARIVQSLDRPLDLQLYRLLDRQLSIKPRQLYTNIIKLARYKLGMQGQKIDAGGRTASSYIAGCIRKSLGRLSREQFTVRMTIDRSSDIFSVLFERIDAQPNQPHEVKEVDLSGELIREFFFHAHGVPREQKRARLTKADRLKASEWLEAYGIDKAKWMVERCVQLQKERGSEPILVFQGLALYENAASGAYEKFQAERAGQLRLAFEAKLDRLWAAYQKRLVEMFDASATADQLAELEEEASRRLPASSFGAAPPELLKLNARALCSDLKRERMNALSEKEFRAMLTAHKSLPELRESLAARHGFDALSGLH